MDQLFTEAECGDMLREVLTHLTAVPWKTEDYFLVCDHSSSKYRLMRDADKWRVAPGGYLRNIHSDIRQYAAVAGVCKWAYQVAVGMPGNLFKAWRDFLARITTTSAFANCDIVDIVASQISDSIVWPITGNHRSGPIQHGQMYMNHNIRAGGKGVRCWYGIGNEVGDSLTLDWMYDTVSVRLLIDFRVESLGIEIKGDSGEEIYENLLQWAASNFGYVEVADIIISRYSDTDTDYTHIHYYNEGDQWLPYTRGWLGLLDMGADSLLPLLEQIPHREEIAGLLAHVDSTLRSTA